MSERNSIQQDIKDMEAGVPGARDRVRQVAAKLASQYTRDEIRDIASDMPKRGRPSIEQTMAGLPDATWNDLLNGPQVEGIHKPQDWDLDTIETGYHFLTAPIVYVLQLPILSAKLVSRFAKRSKKYAERYWPAGAPVIDHLTILLMAVMPLLDAFRRRRHEAPAIPKGAKHDDDSTDQE